MVRLIVGAIFLCTFGCATEFHVYKSKPGESVHNGIPFYLPKAMVLVRAPIEVGRREHLFAVLDAGGLRRFLFPLKIESLRSSLDALKALLGKEVAYEGGRRVWGVIPKRGK